MCREGDTCPLSISECTDRCRRGRAGYGISVESRRTVVLATQNPAKADELRDMIRGMGVEVCSTLELGAAEPVEEDGATFEENALKKARTAASSTGRISLADDSGLEVDALGGFPGTISSRFAGAGASDEEKIARLLGLLRDVPPERRTARFRCVIAIALPTGEATVVEGTCAGVIADGPRGHKGFGYDPVFLVPSLGKTFAELTPEEKTRLSHRGVAMRRAIPILLELLDRRGVAQSG
jgi:XTP/dITP diphosphohydrolase